MTEDKRKCILTNEADFSGWSKIVLAKLIDKKYHDGTDFVKHTDLIKTHAKATAMIMGYLSFEIAANAPNKSSIARFPTDSFEF